MDNSLIASHLRLQRGQRWLIDDVSLMLACGELVALIGPNGAGKSTLLRLLTGYLSAEQGECWLAGQSLTQWPARALSRRRAVMLQQTQLRFDWPVEAIVAMGRAPWGALHEAEIVREVMALTGCDDLARRHYATLSGGEQQRVQLARSLAQLWNNGAPEGWLFLDEPTSALDLYHQQQLLRLLKKLIVSGKLHVCIVLHDLNLAALWADRVLLLNNGKLVAQGTPRQVIQTDVITQWYGAEVEVRSHPGSDTPHVFLCS
ncbi:heme ABC transporter ATP-binding protein [Superficieibacter electus]|uniref:Heme ABC transporter ATP-binding protein n=1 Tax=Superficieibacter electus TaxID=2022662 RepID=A0A2P5GNP5_9ENTR|nr:heme ABC transporter ATP-binding protein [Superficieibacter electus]POP44023.1 heme ABC transporter ATP-binding protein [Superficieibacter electus]POP48195.1 heme ABC transporter ATP-binding protein [Superficieibacter electus]